MDFSPLLEHPNNRIWEQFRERMSSEEYDAFVQSIRENSGKSGLYKCEHVFGSRFQSILLFYCIRLKCYACLVHLENENNVYTSFLKKTLKGAVLRTRANCLELADFFRFASLEEAPLLQQDMRKIASHNWSVYFQKLSRYSPTIFCRKRYLLNAKSGLTVPHGFLADSREGEGEEDEEGGGGGGGGEDEVR